ncbi:MAG: hypothetical protein ISN64_01475 [Rickettsia sp.]|nr:hypothetical protein [Rickettsia sp.]
MVFVRIKNLFIKIYEYLVNFPKYFINFVRNFLFFLYKAKIKLNNFLKTNIFLGIYHLKNGNIKDAILRFKIIDMFFSKGNKEANYWLTWSYLLLFDDQKIEKSKNAAYISQNTDLIEFFDHHLKMDAISEAILKQYRNLTSRYYHNSILYKNVIEEFFLTNFFDFIFEYFVDRNIDEKDLNKNAPKLVQGKILPILEIFNGNGFLGKKIKEKFSDQVILDGMELSSQMHNISSLLEIYNNNYLFASFKDFFQKKNSQYEIIFSSQIFGVFRELDNIFFFIKASLKKNGYFIFLVHLFQDESQKSKFDISKFQFSYQESYIKELIVKYQLKTIIQCNYKKDKKEKFSYFSMFILQNIS